MIGEVALEQLRNTAGKLHNVDAASDFTLRICEDLAVFGGDHVRQGVFVLVEQLQKLEHHSCAPQGRCVGPCGKRSLSGGDGLINILCIGQTHAARDGTRGWIENVLCTGRGARDFVT